MIMSERQASVVEKSEGEVRLPADARDQRRVSPSRWRSSPRLHQRGRQHVDDRLLSQFVGDHRRVLVAVPVVGEPRDGLEHEPGGGGGVGASSYSSTEAGPVTGRCDSAVTGVSNASRSSQIRM